MTAPAISDNPLYRLLREGRVEEFNQRVAAGEQVDLSACDFRHLNLQGLETKGLNFANSYFRQSDIRGVDFTECLSLEGASFHGAKISGAFFPKQIRAEEILLSLEHGTRIRYSV